MQTTPPSAPWEPVLRAVLLQQGPTPNREAAHQPLLVPVVVVVLSGVATGLTTISDGGVVGFAARVLIALIGWAGWIQGARLARRATGRDVAGATTGQLAYVLGLAHAPLLLRPISLLTTADALVALLLLAWAVAAAAVGINQALIGQPLVRRALVTVGGLVGYLVATGLAGIIFLR